MAWMQKKGILGRETACGRMQQGWNGGHEKGKSGRDAGEAGQEQKELGRTVKQRRENHILQAAGSGLKGLTS